MGDREKEIKGERKRKRERAKRGREREIIFLKE